MKRTILSLGVAMLALASICFGAGGDIKISQKNAADTAWKDIIVPLTLNGILQTNGSGVPFLSGTVPWLISSGDIYVGTSSANQIHLAYNPAAFGVPVITFDDGGTITTGTAFIRGDTSRVVISGPTGGEVDVRIANSSVGVFTSTGLNSCAVGATTPSSGQFTTITATGLIRAAGAAATPNAFLLANGTTTSGAYGEMTNTGANMIWGIEGSAAGFQWTGSAAYAGYMGTIGATDLQFFTNNTLAATFDTSQNVAFVKSVYGGGATASNPPSATRAGFQLSDPFAVSTCIFSSGADGATTHPLLSFYNANGLVGSISVASSATTYNTSSDGRLKTNIRDFSDSGRIIDGLRPRIFDWKTGAKNEVGFVAQEENSVDPLLARIGAVTVGDDNPTSVRKQWQRSDQALIPIVVAEEKALRSRVAQLENRSPADWPSRVEGGAAVLLAAWALARTYRKDA